MARIDKERCVGCGICAGMCPDGIEMRDGKAEIKNDKVGCLRDAAESCPQRAILLDDKGAGNSDTNRDSGRDYGQGGWGQGSGQGRGMGSGRGRGLGRGPRDGRGRGMGGGGRRGL